MSRPLCWVIENYEYRPCNAPTREFHLPVCLHGHSYHSEENIGRLNHIMRLPGLNIINEYFNASFRAKAHDDLDYSDIHYNPPLSPEEVWEMELKGVRTLGFDRLLFAITDHDKIAGCQELMETRPDLIPSTTISEELSIYFEKQAIHLGIHGIPRKEADEIHKNLQAMAKSSDYDGIFHLLHEKKCLVIFNHPMWKLHFQGDFDSALVNFLKRYRAGIHAFEFNGLRHRQENDNVIDLARRYQIPLIGGGDRHTFIPSLVMTASREAETYADFIEEVKNGWGVVIVKNDYFVPLWWKMTVRIMQYVQHYRSIVFYKNIPLSAYPLPERILPDFFADLSRISIKFLTKLNLVR